jgi:flagellar basal body-associated protein FliL
MKRFKKIMRMVSLILMIVLASVGLGMGSVFLLSSQKKRDDDFSAKTELVEGKEDKLLLKKR